ncbi:hypothetical protein SLE2022_101720 [Rubroshorea leprosula]
MGRAPCCDKANVKKGPWSPEEDAQLKEFIEKNGTGGNWIALPQKAGLRRCGKSCRLRWLNYLRPNIKHGDFSEDEDRIICSLYVTIGSRWSIIATQLPGRTDNDIKNYWNTKLKKKLMGAVPPPHNYHRKVHQPCSFSALLHQASSSKSSLPSPPLSSSSSSSLSYTPNYYTPFSGVDTIAYSPSNFLSSNSTTTASCLLQTQESLLAPMQHYQVKDSVLMFGGETSCSSSDGSCSNNQISHGKDQLDHDYQQYGDQSQQMGMQNYFYNGVQEQKLMVSSSNGLWGDQATLDNGLEEIKQLISSTANSSDSFLFDEIKIEEKGMYY